MLVEAEEQLILQDLMAQGDQEAVEQPVYPQQLELLIPVAAEVVAGRQEHVVQAVPAVQELLLLKKLPFVV
tara:strand:+ start:269 stop:481 length:213 start_codon:yes stop_codon:yes gene_type:complete